jgi:hypothetical protein
MSPELRFVLNIKWIYLENNIRHIKKYYIYICIYNMADKVKYPKSILLTKSVDCNKCNQTFANVYIYNRHINKKIPCDAESLNNYKTNKKKCPYCEKILCSYASARNHISVCKRKDDPITDSADIVPESEPDKDKDTKLEELQKLITKINSDNQELRDIISKMNKPSEIHTNSHNNNNTNNSHNNTVNNNIQQTINLVAYGKESLDHISDQTFTKIIKKGFMSIPSFIETLHFDKNKPEYHNIYISNSRGNTILQYDGEKWIIVDKTDCLQEIIDNKSSVLSEKFGELNEHLDEATKKRFERFQEEIDTDRTKQQIKTELKMILYNNKNIPEQTRTLAN